MSISILFILLFQLRTAKSYNVINMLLRDRVSLLVGAFLTENRLQWDAPQTDSVM